MAKTADTTTVIRNAFQDRALAWVACAASIALGLVYAYMVNYNVKWAAYLFIAPFGLILLYLYDKLYLKIALVVALLVFAEKILVSQRQPVPFITVGITLVFLLVTILSFMDKGTLQKILQQKPLLWFLFLLTPFLAILISQSREEGFFFVQTITYQIYYVEFYLFFILGLLLYKTPDKIDMIFFILIVVGGLIAVAHLFSISTGINLEAIRGSEEIASHRDLTSAKNWRYGGVFGNPNTMAAYHVMFIPVGLMMLASRAHLIKKFIVMTSLTLMTLSLIFAGSRGGLLFCIVTTILAVCLLRLKLKDLVLFGMAIVMIACVTIFITDTYFYEFYDRVLFRFSEEGFDPGVRMEIWRASWQTLVGNPFGIGVYWEIFVDEFSKHSLLYFANPHNIYLSIALKGGFVGVFCFIIILGFSLQKSIQGIRHSDEFKQQGAKYCLLVIVGFALFGFTEPIFSNGYKINHIIALVLGFAWSLSLTDDEQNDSLTDATISVYGENC